MRKAIVLGMLAIFLAVWLVPSTAGQVQSTPGFGTGVVKVEGAVDVRRLPAIDVGQRGEWRVALAQVADTRVVNTPTVAIAAPAGVRSGGRYEVTWPNGDREAIVVDQTSNGAWVRVAVEGRQRWLNLAAARAIDETP